MEVKVNHFSKRFQHQSHNIQVARQDAKARVKAAEEKFGAAEEDVRRLEAEQERQVRGSGSTVLSVEYSDS